MFNWLKRLFKSMPSSISAGSQWTGTNYIDAYRRNRAPSKNEMIEELKGAAWTCASINAAICANFPPQLYITSEHNDPTAKCKTKALSRKEEDRLRSRKDLPRRITKAAKIEVVHEHPLLDLLEKVNPVHNAFDLWELTTLYQEVTGSAYWKLDISPLGTPEQIWILPAQNMTPKRNSGSGNLVDYYQYWAGTAKQDFPADQVIHFRYPDPRDPYLGGLSPLRACFEQVALTSDYTAMKKSLYENHAIPGAIISPDEVIGEEERDRIEAQWNSKFRKGGAGKVVVGESGLKVSLLQQSLGDLAALADMKVTKEDIANAFHVPLSYLTSNTNLANLVAAESQHKNMAISPRVTRRDQKINEQLIPLYDPTRRLFVASEDPTPVDADQALAQRIADIKYGIVTINEVRGERGLPPVEWGDVPWLPVQWERTDYDRRVDEVPGTGRGKKPPKE